MSAALGNARRRPERGRAAGGRRRSACAALVVGAWCAATCVPATAAAQPQAVEDPIELRWSAPAACPDGARVRGEIDRLLGGKASASSGKRLRATAEVFASEAGGWRLKLATESAGAAGERSLRDDSCEALANTAALILAMAFDPQAVAEAERARAAAAGGPPAPATGSAPASVVPPGTPAAPPTATTTRTTAGPDEGASPEDAAAPSSSDAFAGVRLAGDTGTMLAPTLGVEVAAGYRWERLRLEADATFWFDRGVDLAGNASKGGEFSFVSGALGACGLLLRGAVEVGACGALELGRVHAEGRGTVTESEATVLWVAGRATANAAISFTEAAWLRADAGVAVPAGDRTRWDLTNAGSVGTSPVAVARFAVGPEVRF